MAMNPRLLRPRASGFNPKTVAGLEGWWDAADASSVTLDSGRVSTWADKSGKGRNSGNGTSGSTQPDYITAARNGKNAIRFAGASTQQLTVVGTSAFNFLHNGTNSYVAAVASFGSSSDPNALMSLLGNSAFGSANVGCAMGFDDRAANSTNNGFLTQVARASLGNVALVGVSQDVITPQSATVVEVLLDADNATAASRLSQRFNGGAASTPNTTSNAPSTSNATFNLQFGCAGNNALPMTGDICEILIYSQHPAADAQASIRRYLAAKWGVTLV